MNSNNEDYEEYKYLSFMMYNLAEYLDINKYNEYILAFEGGKEVILNYPAKNITQYFYIEVKGRYEYKYEYETLLYYFYQNNTEPILIKNENGTTYPVKTYEGLFKENNNYYIKLSFKDFNKMIRIVIYILDNNKNIIEVKELEKDIQYGYTSFRSGINYGPTYRFFFINIENVPINEMLAYNVFEPFNGNKYTYSYKFYENYNIIDLPNAFDIRHYDYDYVFSEDIIFHPILFIYKRINAKGVLLQIESTLFYDNDEEMHNEMIMYLKSKKLFIITENKIVNYTQLLKKMLSM